MASFLCFMLALVLIGLIVRENSRLIYLHPRQRPIRHLHSRRKG